MKMVVKRIQSFVAPGGAAYALCDAETGEMLPLQTRCVVDTGIDQARVSVEFVIDGDLVSIA